MGQCPRCGKKQILGGNLCPNCQSAVSAEQQRRNVDSLKKSLPQTFDRILWNTVNARFGKSQPTEQDWNMIHNLIRTDRDQFIFLVNGITTDRYVSGMIYNPSTKKMECVYVGWEATLIDGGNMQPAFYDGRARDMNTYVHQALSKVNLYCNAEIAIRAGRYEDAARFYENLTMYEEAGRIRKNALAERNTSRNVSVNMNQLIDQVRQGGLALAYKCPNCGGSINIDKDFNPGMRVCAYCGTPLDTTVIATMIKNL
jgi:uncharacterized Zn finger protein (UPF0148 family)